DPTSWPATRFPTRCLPGSRSARSRCRSAAGNFSPASRIPRCPRRSPPAKSRSAGRPAAPASPPNNFASPPSATSSATTPSPLSLPPSLPQVTIIADGNPGDDGRSRDFDQAALLATLRVSRPQEGVAYERFTEEGPLALLPLPESGLWSLVWCAPTQVSQD